jgi:hypothetical protein
MIKGMYTSHPLVPLLIIRSFQSRLNFEYIRSNKAAAANSLCNAFRSTGSSATEAMPADNHYPITWSKTSVTVRK